MRNHFPHLFPLPQQYKTQYGSTSTRATGSDRRSRDPGRVSRWVRALPIGVFFRTSASYKQHGYRNQPFHISHPMKGHSAFIQACDWHYIEAALTFFFLSFFFFLFSFFSFFHYTCLTRNNKSAEATAAEAYIPLSVGLHLFALDFC